MVSVSSFMSFFASFVKWFPATLGCSDCVYGEISIVPTKLVSNPVSKFLLEKKLRSLKLAVSLNHHSVSPSPICPYLDETSHLDSFWNGICDVCIFFLIFPHPPASSPPSPKNLPPYF